MNGGDPFALLFNLNNIDGKALVPAWLRKKPLLTKWTLNKQKNQWEATVEVNESDYDLADYIAKYASKACVPPKTKGNVLLASSAKLQPENAITTGTMTKVYNKVSDMGAQPIFQAVHKNMKLPLVFQNIYVKLGSVLGISMIQKSSKESKNDEENDDNRADYVLANVMEKFNMRWNSNTVANKTIKENEYKTEMSLKYFCDKYTVTVSKVKDSNEQKLHIQGRSNENEVNNSFYPLRLSPHMTDQKANPKSSKHWMYCMYLCLWITPCKTIDELLPDPNLTEDKMKAYWTTKFNNLWEKQMELPKEDRILPLWVRRFHSKFTNQNSDEDSDEETDAQKKILDDLPGKSDKSDNDTDKSEDEFNDDPRAKRHENAFHQDLNDQLHARCTEEEPDSLMDANMIEMSNPTGENFMKWAEGKPIPSNATIVTRLQLLKTISATHDFIPDVQLNSKQTLFKHLVHGYVQQWHNAYLGKGEWPMPLRAFLMGNPGVGKSITTKVTMKGVRDILQTMYEDVVKEATPTGCASFQMSAGATTIHTLLGLKINPSRTVIDKSKVKMLEQKFPSGLCLLVLDEFSMESRSMISVIFERLRLAHIDFEKMGVIFIGDSAQLLPIGGVPCWSIKMGKYEGKDFSTDSLFGLNEFREIFRMPKLEDVPNYNQWQEIEVSNSKVRTEAERKVIAKFTLDAYMYKAMYQAVYLTEILRSVAGDKASERMVRHLIPNSRYGKTTEQDLLELRELYASKQDVASDPAFLKANIGMYFHYYTSNDVQRQTVESENLHGIFEHSQRYDKPVVHLQCLHTPVAKASDLAKVSGKEFEGLLNDFVACEDIPLMILTNIATKFGLFNGAICYFKGLLYFPDDAELHLTPDQLKDAVFKGTTLDKPIDLKSNYQAQYHVLQKGSILVAINDTSVASYEDIMSHAQSHEPLKCIFTLPKAPPAMPDYIVVQSDAYKNRGGPNILGFMGAEDLIPIPLFKAFRQIPGKKDTTKGKHDSRIGFKTEIAIAATIYKFQGATKERLILKDLKQLAHVPGAWLVSNTRTKHPKHTFIPEGHWPNAMDINLQRLNYFVTEAEIFEMAIKIKAAHTLRLYSVGENDAPYGESWTKEEYEMADYISGHSLHKDLPNTLPETLWNSIQKELRAKESYPAYLNDRELFARVLEKTEHTDERLCRVFPPFLAEGEYQNLVRYQKGTKQLSKKKPVDKDKSAGKQKESKVQPTTK